MNVETAQRLADLRRSKGFSQEGLARKLGLSRQAVSKWERAESSPDTENLISLAKLYGVSLDELLNPSDEIEDDIEFENEDRARQREAEAAERAVPMRRRHVLRRQQRRRVMPPPRRRKRQAGVRRQPMRRRRRRRVPVRPRDSGEGPFQSFPYWAVCWLLFFLLMFRLAPAPLLRSSSLRSHLSLGGACARWRLGARGYSGWSGAGGG